MSSEGFKALKVPSNHSSTSVASSETVTETSKPSHKPEEISSPHELTAFVEAVLGQLETRFDEMSSQIMERMGQMSARVDTLETSIQDLINGDLSVPRSDSPGLGGTSMGRKGSTG